VASLTEVKGNRRTWILEEIMDLLTSPRTYEDAKSNLKEREIKRDINKELKRKLLEIQDEINPTEDEELLRKKAKNSLFWEQSDETTINNFKFLGVQHRPDFEVQVDGNRYAVEIKIGRKGSDIRSGLGQSLVYVKEYDFTAYVFLDNSRDGKIKRAIENDFESRFIESLWDNYNVQFDVVDI
jgi:hypothetical protein